jgi:hypothetical protein
MSFFLSKKWNTFWHPLLIACDFESKPNGLNKYFLEKQNKNELSRSRSSNEKCWNSLEKTNKFYNSLQFVIIDTKQNFEKMNLQNTTITTTLNLVTLTHEIVKKIVLRKNYKCWFTKAKMFNFSATFFLNISFWRISFFE